MERPLPNPAHIASLAPTNFDDAKRLVALVPGAANAIEYRLDLASGRISPRALLELDPRCAIVTYRSSREGGRFDGSLEEYRKSVQSARDAGAVVDVELESGLLDDGGFLPDRSRVIGSRHGPGEWSDSSVSRWCAAGAAAIKLVQTDVRSVAAAAACVSLARRWNPRRPFASFATGRVGILSRVLGPRFGSALAYGSVGAPTAEGQVPLRDLLDVYGIAGGRTPEKIFAVYGADVSSSLSPRIHNALFSRRGLPWVYVPVCASEGRSGAKALGDDLDGLGAADLSIHGLSVTNPFKSAFVSVVHAIDEDDAVARTGAANTLVLAEEEGEGRFVARNTDADAILEILADRSLSGRRLVVLGNGGAARAAAYAAGLAGCEVFLAGRDLGRVKPVADRFGASAVALSDLPRVEADVLVNATPLGVSEEDPVPFPPNLLGRRPAVLDFAYRKAGETRLMAEARERGCIAADGREILARQAVGQARLFGVEDATFEEIDAILRGKAAER